jgi:hypothetical protein
LGLLRTRSGSPSRPGYKKCFNNFESGREPSNRRLTVRVDRVRGRTRLVFVFWFNRSRAALSETKWRSVPLCFWQWKNVGSGSQVFLGPGIVANDRSRARTGILLRSVPSHGTFWLSSICRAPPLLTWARGAAPCVVEGELASDSRCLRGHGWCRAGGDWFADLLPLPADTVAVYRKVSISG